MAVQLQQMHPALVHLPITLLPLAVGADMLGCLTKNKSLFGFGQKAIGLAAVAALGAAVTSLIAGEEVNVKGETQDMLMTPQPELRRDSARRLDGDLARRS